MNRYAHCHFCDDIRFEIGNKTTLVGLYSGEMFVSEIPAVLSKLCFFVLFATGVDDPVRSFSIRVSDKDQVLVEQTLEEDAFRTAFEQAAKRGTQEDPIQRLTIALNLVATPFIVQKENVITVTVVPDGQEMIAGKLRVKLAKNNQGSP